MASDFDALLEGASAEEAKRLWRILCEWCNGDENSFPVHLALLTRAQWRAQTRIPHLVNESVKAMDLKWADYRQQTAALVKDLAKTADAKAKDLERIVIMHSIAVNEATANMQAQLRNAEAVAEQIKGQLTGGVLEWNKARSDFAAERERLEQVSRELEERLTWREWLWYACLVTGLVGIGIGIGVHLAR